MDIRRWTRTMALTATTALAATACAGGTGMEEGMPGPEGESVVVVNNQNTTISTATIYLYPENGVRERLGTITLNEEKRFVVTPRTSVEYQLVAEEGTDEMVSRPFTLTRGDVIEWSLDLNQINLREAPQP